MTYAEADAQYEVIKQQYLSGALDDEQFDEQLHRLMVLDAGGVWWAKSRENGSWHYYDIANGDWIAAAPLASGGAAAPPSSLPGTPPVEPLPAQLRASEPPTADARPAASGAGESDPPRLAAVKPGASATGGAGTAFPASNASAAGSRARASTALPSTSQGAPATAASYNAADFGPLPELTGGMKVLFYVLALLLPILGLILFLIYRHKPAQADRTAARVFLILGIASIVFSCMCSTTFLLLESTLGAGTAS